MQHSQLALAGRHCVAAGAQLRVGVTHVLGVHGWGGAAGVVWLSANILVCLLPTGSVQRNAWCSLLGAAVLCGCCAGVVVACRLCLLDMHQHNA